MQYLSGVSREEFENDLQRQDAVIRRIEIMGEATKRISQDVRKRFSDLPWKEMAGMRDRVIHGYDMIDLDIVWDTAQYDFPVLAQQLEDVLDSFDLESGNE